MRAVLRPSLVRVVRVWVVRVRMVRHTGESRVLEIHVCDEKEVNEKELEQYLVAVALIIVVIAVEVVISVSVTSLVRDWCGTMRTARIRPTYLAAPAPASGRTTGNRQRWRRSRRQRGLRQPHIR